MRNEIKICALILARGGSKRLPNKNIKSFNGKPLISWTVISAINSNRFDKVYCYSDDSKILDACIIEASTNNMFTQKHYPFVPEDMDAGDGAMRLSALLKLAMLHCEENDRLRKRLGKENLELRIMMQNKIEISEHHHNCRKFSEVTTEKPLGL